MWDIFRILLHNFHISFRIFYPDLKEDFGFRARYVGSTRKVVNTILVGTTVSSI